MLDLDLDLEADLGIDTVKQAEMFAAVRAAYNIPRDENLKLRDVPTMAAVIKFARDRAGVKPAVAAQLTPTTTAPAAPKKVEAPRPPLASFDAANKIPRRVPVPVLRPPLNLCKPTRVTLSLGRRVLVMGDKQKDNVAHALRERLGALGVEVMSINDSPDVETLTNRLSGWLA